MKILHLTFTYPPDPPGGTEVYVGALCQELGAMGLENVVVSPGRRDERYRRDGLRVRRFGVEQHGLDLVELYGDGDLRAAEAFDRILEEERPDIVHQHALTSAVSVLAAERARQRGAALVFTYHTPAVSCQRGTLLEWGSRPCDGRMDVTRCTGCTLHGLGVARPVGRVLASLPGRASDLVGQIGLSGGAWTALRMRSLTRLRIESFRKLVSLTDTFVALTPWARNLLLLNGVPEDKITDSAHGLARYPAAPDRVRTGGERLRVIHFGRMDPAKGTSLLIEALGRIPEAPIDLDVFGIVQSDADAGFLTQLRRAVGNDTRVRLLPALEHAELLERLGAYDIAAVPSQWLETGPLVVLEAFAAGVPVLGSDLAGLADKVTDGIDGLLVRPFDSVEAWKNALLRCASDQTLVDRLSRGIRPPRSMTDVAQDMAGIYRNLAARAAAQPGASLAGAATAGAPR